MTDTPDLHRRVAAAIDSLRDNGGIYAMDDAERDRITDAVLAAIRPELVRLRRERDQAASALSYEQVCKALEECRASVAAVEAAAARVRETRVPSRALDAAVDHEPAVHDYRRGHRTWGHNLVVHSSDDGTLRASGWGRGVHRGDHLLVDNDGRPARLEVTDIEYLPDPSDMWRGGLRPVKEAP